MKHAKHSAGRRQAPRKKKPLLWVILILAVILVAVVALLLGRSGEEAPVWELSQSMNTESEETAASTQMETPQILLHDGVYVTTVLAASGIFVEDGSDELVENVMCAVLENTGDTAIQLLDFVLADAAGTEYTFRVTTLLPGAVMVVQEQNRAPYDPATEIVSARTENVALFGEPLSMHEELLAITTGDYSITVENISGKDFPGGRVFYKTVANGVYQGGITYMITLPELAPGESVQRDSLHFLESRSELMFVTYAAEE